MPHIGDVDAGPPPGTKSAVYLTHHIPDQFQILSLGQVQIVLLTHIVEGRSDHQMHRIVGNKGELPGVAVVDLVQVLFEHGAQLHRARLPPASLLRYSLRR